MKDRELIKKIIAAVIIAGIVIFAGIQLIPVKRTNPPVTMDVDANDEVKGVLKKSCYSCHSNETVWPWYSYVAPVSWLITDDVETARGSLNFSEWDRFDQDYRIYLIGLLIERVEQGDMPPKKYLALNPDAKIKEHDLKILKEWEKSALD